MIRWHALEVGGVFPFQSFKFLVLAKRIVFLVVVFIFNHKEHEAHKEDKY